MFLPQYFSNKGIKSILRLHLCGVKLFSRVYHYVNAEPKPKVEQLKRPVSEMLFSLTQRLKESYI